MNSTLDRIRSLVNAEAYRASDHAYHEAEQRGIDLLDAVESLETARLIEDYPDYPKGPSVLLFQRDRFGEPIHVVWGIPSGHDAPAVIVTAYRPDPARWADGYTRRKR